MGLLDKLLDKLIGEESGAVNFLKQLRGCEDDKEIGVEAEPC